ncbi:class I SAM-dependent methyltransferase [Patescibacteria group bacterium]|nr:class I SAM-dependent methyltransferase [Patescibacteria group bacterium]
MIKYWRPEKIEEVNDSPGRVYSNRFLYDNLLKILPSKEVKMLDIGCGSGYIRKIFYDLGYKLFYTGVDIEKNKNFEQFNKYAVKSDFIKIKIEDFNTNNKYNLVFSISALEHIDKDVLAVSKAREFLEKGGIQIHIIPTFWSVFLYLRHGYRRYTPVRFKKIFGDKFKVYRIGGLFSFFLHLFFITIPEIILKNNKLRKSNIYPKLLNTANKFDRFLPIFSSFYILVIKNENKDL